MGYTISATCRECGCRFKVKYGGGFVYHQLRCDRCGEAISVGFHELGDLHLRYVKELPKRPYAFATSERDIHIKDHVKCKYISKKDYYKGVEEFAGKCVCGGDFTMDAPPRCPKCRSDEIEEGEIIMHYD